MRLKNPHEFIQAGFKTIPVRVPERIASDCSYCKNTVMR